MREDDFFDKYVDSNKNTPAKKGSAKKDLLGMKREKKESSVEGVELSAVIEDTKSSVSNVSNTTNQVKREQKVEVNLDVVEEVVDKPKRTRTRKKVVEEDVNVEVTKVVVVDELAEVLKRAEEDKEEIIEVPQDIPAEPKQKRSRKKQSDKMISLEDYNTNYITKSLSQTIHESMIPYSEFVIMDRAIPRVEDGLKPVQRRVLYSMLEVGVLPDRPYKKSASIVGECMGKYHPHGDTSIYDTLVRMAQNFNMSEPLVDGHGNFGSVDGDPPAAMRYTEAKLTPLAMEMLRDLEKDTVTWGLNFDDRLKEPQMLPGRFPNLLVNGCQGIAVGLATNIPTHNLAEACNAVIAYIDNRNITLDEIMKVMPAPDFPSGGYILDTSELKQIYEKGKGKIFIRSKISIENADNGRKNIVITEIPYQINKANMLQKIAKYRDANINGPLGAIQEIVDESDRFGTRAVIKLKKEAKINTILNTLYKYCDLQTTFGANIIAIADGKPKQMGLLEILDYYVNYQQRVIYNRTKYDLEEALKKEHILEGLLIAIRNIDEVVRIIKNSKSVTDAKITLIKTFELSEIQAQAILDMRLARLTNLEVNKLITDLNRLRDLIKRYTAIVKSPTLQMKVVKTEIQEIIKTYGRPRKTKFLSADEHFEDSSTILESIENETEDIQTYHIIATPANTMKLINLKSYKLVSKELSASATLAEIPKLSFKIDDNKDVYVMTNLGNSVKVPVKSIGEFKFRDKGLSLFNMVKNIKNDENIVAMLELDNSIKDTNLVFVTKSGMIKISKVSDFLVTKQVIASIKLAKNDEVVYVDFHNPDKKLSIFTANGNAVKVDTADIPVSGRVGIGVKGIALDKGDCVVSAIQTGISDAYAMFFNDGHAKIVKQIELPDSARNRKGLGCLGAKQKSAKMVFVGVLRTKISYVMENDNGKLTHIALNMLPLDTRTGNGKLLSKEKIKHVYQYIDNQK